MATPKRRTRLIAAVAVVVAALVGLSAYAGSHTPTVAGLTYLDESLDPFAAAFDGTAGVPRLVLLLSPA